MEKARKSKAKKLKKASRKVAAEHSDNIGGSNGDLMSSDKPVRKEKWTNRQRVLVFGARGITAKVRHMLGDLRTLFPHSKTESKFDRGEPLSEINEIADRAHCNKVVFFECRKRRDAYMWLACAPNGPSVKFHVESMNTMNELRLTGNCLKGSRPILSFDSSFERNTHMQLLKEMFVQAFGTPRAHPKSKPFTDRVATFSLLDDRIWLRNYQVVAENGSLCEIGPRLTLRIVKIFAGAFGGTTLYSNGSFVTPNASRAVNDKQSRYTDRVVQRERQKRRRTTPNPHHLIAPLDERVFGESSIALRM